MHRDSRFRLVGQPPNRLYQLVMNQVEQALLHNVLVECGGNQSKAAQQYLGISRGTLRSKLCVEKPLKA